MGYHNELTKDHLMIYRDHDSLADGGAKDGCMLVMAVRWDKVGRQFVQGEVAVVWPDGELTFNRQSWPRHLEPLLRNAVVPSRGKAYDKDLQSGMGCGVYTEEDLKFSKSMERLSSADEQDMLDTLQDPFAAPGGRARNAPVRQHASSLLCPHRCAHSRAYGCAPLARTRSLLTYR